jgi:hypothetical protein
MMFETINANWNLALHAIDRRGRKKLLFRDHNIFLNTGREYLTHRISAFEPSAYTVAYIGWGIGGDRQVDADADLEPMLSAYPGSNTQPDTDVLVTQIERPVLVRALTYLQPMSLTSYIGPTAVDPARVTYQADFLTTDFTAVGGYAKVPLSEIMLYLSSADPALANGGAGTHGIAYKTFATIPKTSFAIQASWELRV